MSFRRKPSESCRKPSDGLIDPNDDPDEVDISLVRSDSQESLSWGGDSDGGPAEPTPAEISLLSASIDARNLEAARGLGVPSVAEALKDAPIEQAQEDPEEVEVTPVFPAGFHRLPSAMRPPVRRGHVRSASAGGNFLHFRNQQPQQVHRTVSSAVEASTEATAALNRGQPSPPPSAPVVIPGTTVVPLASVLKGTGTSNAVTSVASRSSASAAHKQHRRVFSHGHISFGGKEVISTSVDTTKIGQESNMPPR